ncbi:hypothetical protein FIBSPDRAFT_873975 [Athelia psychrophila]|uniref:Uncharacterized protein n=1 Tax=Athelia psychrophila TaxID=1759441 RepID=A0A165XY63_9AGAM|nr:hypothetical protein FIBSPDRAFT_873975 [Fibularhizoctonia sp. CBS 109695]
MTAIRGGPGFKNVKTWDRGRCQIAMRHEDTKLKRFTALSETNETGLQILWCARARDVALPSHTGNASWICQP